MSQLAGALVVIAVFGFLAFIFWGMGRGKYAEMQMLYEMQKQILEKIGSGPEVTQFIASKEGQEFCERLKLPQPKSKKKVTPYSWVGSMIMWGFIAAGVGVGLLIAAHFYTGWEIVMWGCILTGAGIGLLIAAGIVYRLFKKLGVLQKRTAE